jgi:hypothetical protein
VKIEQKQPTKTLDERTDEVLAEIKNLGWMPKFPQGDKQVTLVARCIAMFCETVEVNHVFHHDEFTEPEQLEKDKAMELGWVRPIDWLVEQVASTYFSFPAPIVWRTIYQTRFTPLDGRRASDLTGAAEV